MEPLLDLGGSNEDKLMKHLDLFSGIGGFAYAADQVWENVEHIFCENDKFCQQVIRKHWPNSKIYGDIRFITDTSSDGLRQSQTAENEKRYAEGSKYSGELERGLKGSYSVDLLTGGFPCQPFSQAGSRRGTSDDRYLWGEMARVIQLTKPTWVIAENVYGLLTLQQGVVFEQVCTDLEAQGYEVQPFVIPACGVNAPHRRDRVWIVANRQQLNARSEIKCQKTLGQDSKRPPSGFGRPDWSQNWLEVATKLCGVDDGLPAKLDGFELSKSQHRKERLKSLGNSIVPQVAIEIMKAIRTNL